MMKALYNGGMKKLALKSLYIVSTGGIFFCFSERFFWGYMRPAEDKVPDLLWGLLFYSLAAYIILFLIDRYKIKSMYGLFTIGILLAFIIEGLIIGQLFSNTLLNLFVAFPWHAIVTVIFGWYYLPRLLNSENTLRTVLILTGTGILYTFWAIGWLALSEGAEYTLQGFHSNNFLVIPLLIGCYLSASFVQRNTHVTFSTKEFFIVSGIVLALHILQFLPLLFITLPISFIIILCFWYGFRRIDTHNLSNTSRGITIPDTISRTYLLIILGAVAAIGVTYAFKEHIKIETAYLFAIPLFIASLAYVYKGSVSLFRSNRAEK